jgi:hypothetical protein
MRLQRTSLTPKLALRGYVRTRKDAPEIELDEDF